MDDVVLIAQRYPRLGDFCSFCSGSRAYAVGRRWFLRCRNERAEWLYAKVNAAARALPTNASPRAAARPGIDGSADRWIRFEVELDKPSSFEFGEVTLRRQPAQTQFRE